MRLQLTKRSDYAIRACLFLASSDHVGPASSRRIAEAMDIPVRFLPRVLSDLAVAGIVEVQIGRNGGYRLERPPERLSILEVIETVEGVSRSTVCVMREQNCDASQACAFHPVWEAAQTALIDVLATSTVAELATTQGSVGASASSGPNHLERTRS